MSASTGGYPTRSGCFVGNINTALIVKVSGRRGTANIEALMNRARTMSASATEDKQRPVHR